MRQVTGWIREAVIYQIYVRSFADADGDGVGDLAGIRSRLDYLASLGVDAIWLTPFYDSPFVDGGYDVADYRSVAEVFGRLEDFDALVADAHRLGLRVIIDLVPNHTSDRHCWFQDALKGRNRDRYIFRDEPNDWQSVFGGPAWTQVADGQWYLHLFAPEQPDLNWQDPAVREEFEQILRFWLDRGVDGFRVDVAHGLVKPEGLPSFGRSGERGNRPYFDQDAVHDIYRSWRAVAGSAALVAEARLRDPARTARYARPGEMDQAFNFQFLWAPWDLGRVREAVAGSLDSMGRVGALPTWVIGNHDEIRAATRYALKNEIEDEEFVGLTVAVANETGLRRARAMALLSLALPGAAYIYQGDELGLPEVVDLPDEVREDPIWHRSGGRQRGRDGCRVPLPWSEQASSYGFGPADGKPTWLPQPETWQGFSVAAQLTDPESTLAMYKKALKLRRRIGSEGLMWLGAPPGVLAFARGNGFACAVNFGESPVPLAGLRLPGPVALLSEPADPAVLPAGAAVWVVAP
ncbi:MAG TPA: glycoside hydrolase family 13 protein [Candidatus Limnocylindrales bacterium]|nr:glycoside hydrolase family 13 protein [Candidatus Limnocylindrales bacterium]